MISTDITKLVSYIKKQGGTHSPNLCVEVWEVLKWCLEHHHYLSSSYPTQIQHLSRPPIQIRQTYQNRVGSGSNSSEFHVPDAQFPECGFVCDTIQSQTPIICLSSSRQQSASDRCLICGQESSSCICLSSFYSDPCCSRENLTTSVQNSSHSSVLATTTVILRTSAAFSVSADSSATNSKASNSIQRKICSQNLPVLDLHAWELSNNQSEIKKFRKTLQILSPDQEEHLQKRLIRSRPLLQL